MYVEAIICTILKVVCGASVNFHAFPSAAAAAYLLFAWLCT